MDRMDHGPARQKPPTSDAGAFGVALKEAELRHAAETIRKAPCRTGDMPSRLKAPCRLPTPLQTFTENDKGGP